MENYILVVDDNIENLKVLGNILKENGFKIALVQSGEEALSTLESMEPMLIFLDVMMPDMDGYEVCSRIKQQNNLKDIPVIFLTAKTDTNDIVNGFSIGGVDYITKPFKASELLVRVKTHIDLRKSHETIKQQAEQLQKYNSELEKRVEERTHEIFQQKQVIEQKNKEITESIRYARKIQTAILPPGDFIETLFPERFIFYLPKDIVSGDFYWIAQLNDRIINVTADCTGHGVPGAFMSLLGIAFLNEILSSTPNIHANEILDKLRAKIITALHQTGQFQDSKDGIDIALYIMEKDFRSLEFAGANIPLFIVRDGNLITIEPDRMPIGFHSDTDKPFSNHIVELFSADLLYTSTDGYRDQFGGNSNKKLKRTDFGRLLLQISKYSIEEQKAQIENFFNNWRGENEQIDDILVIGVKIT
jgi:phosphoserine phosphatase RsbU/P